MAHYVGSFVLGFMTLLWTAGLDVANEPVAKGGQSPAKAAAPAKNADEKPAKKSGSSTGGKDDGQKTTGPASSGTSAKSAEQPKTPQQPAKAGQPAAKGHEATPPTHTVKKGPFRVTVDLEGTFEAQTAREIAVRPDEWTALVVETAVAHGTQVREGDVLLTLDPEKIDRAIADLRTEQKLSQLAIRQGEDQLKALEKLTPLDLEASSRAAKMAEEDRKFFTEIDKPFAIKATEFSLKVAKESLEYEEEELHQLEKMYKADDITEETEQIVLKRARDTVKRTSSWSRPISFNTTSR